MNRAMLAVLCAVLASCASPAAAPPEPEPWSHNPPDTFRVGPAPQPRVPPRPSPSLDQMLDEVAATQQERAQVAKALEQAEKDWEAWFLAHQDVADEMREQVRRAREAQDRQAVAHIREKVQSVSQDIPRSVHAWDAIKKVFGPPRQEQLEALRGNDFGGLGERLHESVREVTAAQAHDATSRCTPCHLPWGG